MSGTAAAPGVLAVDVGTSSLRAQLFDAHGRPVEGIGASRRYRVLTTPDGGAELDPDRLLEDLVQCLEETLSRRERAGPAAPPVAAVALCTFWHSVLGVDARGRPTTPIFLWHDTRSREDVPWLKERLDERAVHARTGCLFHTSYLPARLRWLARTRPETFSATRHWLSPGDYFFLKLFGHTACSLSMASGTGLLDQHRRQWDPQLLDALGLPPESLPRLGEPGETFQGLTAPYRDRLPALASIPWFPALGDGACSNVGSGCTGPRRVAVMVGTSGAMRLLSEGLLPTVPSGLWRYRLDERRSLVGGALSNGGNLLVWLQESLRLPPVEELNRLLELAPPDGHGLTVLPFLAGERSPGWASEATGVVAGLRLHTSPVDIVQACLEAVAFRFYGIFSRLQPLLAPGAELVATGGALLRMPAWMQMLSDVLNRPLRCSQEGEASLRGAALTALEALGIIDHLESAPAAFGRLFLPRAQRHAIYQRAIERQARLYRLDLWNLAAQQGMQGTPASAGPSTS